MRRIHDAVDLGPGTLRTADCSIVLQVGAVLVNIVYLILPSDRLNSQQPMCVSFPFAVLIKMYLTSVQCWSSACASSSEVSSIPSRVSLLVRPLVPKIEPQVDFMAVQVRRSSTARY